uniref:Uncharacterized protein n=1 Tax=Knufia peltigerae TaxID=1002370 RepID=A0AA38XR36_9EURO|nr:hypothetical protein H2204_013159 [Knufia peltigerae]
MPGGVTLVVASRRTATVRSAGCLDAHGRQCTPIAGRGQVLAGTQRIVIGLQPGHGGAAPLFKRGTAA